ncbi:MAG: VCBS repeat-containing protein [Actinomycetota bacterium]|nr:VCBS repeat-containing protein [Actinomycetota bacterium]
MSTLAAGALGATSETPYAVERVDPPDPQEGARWAERLAAANDIDGDGTNDFYVATPFLDVDGLNTGRVYLVSGRTFEVLWRSDSPEPQERAAFGFFISAFGDANGDGRVDVAVGTSAQDVGGNVDQGKAWVLSGADGSVLYELDNPQPQPNGSFGSRIGRAGDINGNGVADIIVGASNNDIPAGCGVGVGGSDEPPVPEGCFENVGQAYIFEGANGTPLRELNIPADERPGETRCGSGCGSFGIAVQGPGDTDGDGVTDQLVSAASYNGVGRMYLFSGRTGEVLLRIDAPDNQPGQFFGFQDAAPLSPGDVTGDGLADLYGNGFLWDGPAGEGQGAGWLFDGRTGAVIRRLDDPTPTPGGQFGWSMARTNFNKDGVPDQYIGQAPHHVQGTEQNGGTYVFDGRDGSVFKRFEVPAPDQQPAGEESGPRLGWGLAAPGDLNGDCEPDYLGGAPFKDHRFDDQGRLYAYLSSGPSACRAAAPPPQPQPPVANPCGDPAAAGYLHPAKIRVSRARVLREDRRLDVLAPITARAEGDVKVMFHADDRKDTFAEEVTEANTVLDEIRILEPITRGQAELGTGIVNLEYLGDADTRPEFVRLRAASQRAELDVDEISLLGDRLSARGSVTDRAQGVVRLRFSYVDPDGSPQVHIARATIQGNGDWRLNNDQVPAQLARCGGYLSIQFTGYFPRRIRGEQLAYELNAGQTRTP